MTNDRVNGTSPAEIDPRAPDAQVMDARTYLENWVGVALQCTIRGAIGSLPGYPASSIMVMACRCLGNLVGTVFGGPLVDVLSRRRECREAFLEGLNKAPPPPQPEAAAARWPG